MTRPVKSHIRDVLTSLFSSQFILHRINRSPMKWCRVSHPVTLKRRCRRIRNRRKSGFVTMMLAIAPAMFGICGMHRIYSGHIGIGVAQFFTFGAAAGFGS